MKRLWVAVIAVCCVLCAAAAVDCAQLPSLFRGVVVADSSLGVRVVSVEEASQAALSDLRPEDLIVRVDQTDVRTIDEFSTVSTAMKGRAVLTSVVVVRAGGPQTLTLHLYSYPVLREWGIRFLPDHDFRFAEASVGRDYWARLGRGFEEAGQAEEARDAYLNALHNTPEDVEVAVKAAVLFAHRGQIQLHPPTMAQGLAALRDGMTMMEHLFDFSLTDDQLRLLKQELQATLRAMHSARTSLRSTT